MTPQEDRFLQLSVFRDCRQCSTGLQDCMAFIQTIWNRMHTANLWPHRAASRPVMTALYHQAQHAHQNLNMWKNFMFSDEVRFSLKQFSAQKMWRLRHKQGNGFWWRLHDGVAEHLLHQKDRLVIIVGNLNAQRY